MRSVGTVGEGAQLKKPGSSNVLHLLEQEHDAKESDYLDKENDCLDDRELEDLLKELHVTVSEIYSPPRVTAMLPQGDLLPGFAMDITTNDEDGNPWNFDLHEQ